MGTGRPRLQARVGTSSARDAGWFGRTDLPRELHEGAARRLGYLGLLTAGTMLAFFALFFPSNYQDHAARSGLFPLPLVGVGCALLLSLALFWISRVLRQRTRLLLEIGVVYQLLMALVIGVLHHIMPWELASRVRGWSGVAVWIIIFAVVVPSTPARTLWISVLAALMDLCGLLLTVALGNPFPPAIKLPLMYAPTLMAVVTAVIAARINFRIGRRLQEVQELGSYTLVERLGQGGMGEVWRAEHKMLARPAAVKVIRPDALAAGDEEDAQLVLQRFEREAQATARLESEHTIELYDFGVATDGAFFYVMELLDGLDLEQLVARFGPVPPERAVHLLRQACDSLGEAHAAGLVHRDIKPSNIYVCRKALRHDVIKVLDFGLVKAGPGSSPGDEKLTAAGTITGTPAYMPPEIVEGADRLDSRADLYALGCVAYWLLSGELLFEAASPVKMIASHLSVEPRRLSERAEQPIPAALEQLVHDCLAKDPAARPGDAGQLAERLEALPLERSWTQERAAAWWAQQIGPRGATLSSPAAGSIDPMAQTLADE